MQKQRSLGGTLLIVLVALGLWFARSQGWLPEAGAEPDGTTSRVELPSTGSGRDSAPSEQADEPASQPEDPGPASSERDFEDGADEIARAARSQRSGFMVTTRGVVQRTLPDDDDGHRHQRFILELMNGHTVLVAHNIDLATRVPLGEGDTVDVHGQYEWNDRGGVLHWTHLDPQQRHEAGWIRRGNQLYQ